MSYAAENYASFTSSRSFDATGAGGGNTNSINPNSTVLATTIDEYGEDEQIQWLYTPEQLEYLKSDQIKDNFDDLI